MVFIDPLHCCLTVQIKTALAGKLEFIFQTFTMKRDGALESLWQSGIDAYQTKNTIKAGEVYDVIIAGGGITGITTALLLQQAGKKCAVIEAYNICFGTTGGTTAHLNNFFDTTYAQVSSRFGKESAKLLADAAKNTITNIKQNIKDYKIECGFEETDAYVFAGKGLKRNS